MVKQKKNPKSALSKQNFLFLKEYFLQKSGVSISDDKTYLLDSRLSPLLEKFDINSFDELVDGLKKGKGDLESECIDAISINETYFFRDEKPFRIFEEDIIEKLVENNESNIIRIWSAGCSNGQEPYSIAISLLKNKHRLRGKKFEVIASDISNKAIKKAMEGIYSNFEIERGLPEDLKEKYFIKSSENSWKIKDEIKDFVRFRQENLMEESYSDESFDCVFCRNLMIYFDEKTKKNILDKIIAATKKSGAIFLGSSETSNYLPEKLTQYDKLRSVFFKK